MKPNADPAEALGKVLGREWPKKEALLFAETRSALARQRRASFRRAIEFAVLVILGCGFVAGAAAWMRPPPPVQFVVRDQAQQ
jgi:hypothetical protein